jgi:hypothetical protein
VRKLDVDLAAVIKDVQRTPRPIIALDGVAEAQAADIKASINRRRSIGRSILAAERNELVLGMDS